MAAGLLVIVGGWTLGIELLTTLALGSVSVKASTALCLSSLGAGLLLLNRSAVSPARRLAAQALGVFVLLTGLAFISEYALGWNLGIDELPFRDQVGHNLGVEFPGRIAPTTAMSLMLSGLALLALDARPRRGWRPAELLVIPVALIAFMSLVGYTLEIPAFSGPGSGIKMAVTTAVCFIPIAIGVVISRPNGRLLGLATTTAPGGQMARRMAPLVLLLPLVLGWLRMEAGHVGLFGERMGAWWLTVATIAGMFVVLWRGAARLNASDVERKDLEKQLYEMANYDEMTGLFNRRRFEAEMAAHAARMRRHGGSTCMIEIDLDSLKRVNDKLGHAAGDALITGVAKAISGRARDEDVTGRIGGDEFALLLADTPRAGALKFAGDLQASILAAKPDSTADAAWSTASIGIAHSDEVPEDDGLALLALADDAMYAAKQAGGDRIRGSWFKTRPCRPGDQPVAVRTNHGRVGAHPRPARQTSK